ncbi:glycosyltransferase family 2 protein [Paraflavisolibacter sp. H34]|uniref:glycosyltransferase family 2 protein n=1 Tax=Huijunlia imazamoxiresistens TaxID=3127457 RepID=UPI003018D754
MSNKPLVSVIIPTYNRAGEIHRAVESVLHQTYPAIQLIVIDDGSSDDTATILSRYPQVEYFYKKNGGQASARNAGLERARGVYLASLDSDDTWEPNFLEVCVEKLEQDRLDFVFANWRQGRLTGEAVDFMEQHRPLQPFLAPGADGWVNLANPVIRRMFLTTCAAPSSSLLIRRSSLAGGWNNSMNIGDDWCLILDMVLTKPCTAAFTLQKLWYKQPGPDNVYDGRPHIEIVQLLFVDDTRHLIRRYKSYLSRRELRILLKKYISGLVQLANHSLFRERNLPGFLGLLQQSLSLSPHLTFLSLTWKIRIQSKRRLKRLVTRFS